MTLYSTIVPGSPTFLCKQPIIIEGAVTGLVGKGKIGKGFLTADIAARFSRGWPMPPTLPNDPTVEHNEPGYVIMITPEDNSADTTIHRLLAAGADLSMIDDMSRVERGSASGNTVRHKFSVPGDLPMLRQRIDYLQRGDPEKGIKAAPVKLIVIDPLLAVATTTLAFNQQLRLNVLDKLEELALTTGVAILLVHHLNKGTIKSLDDLVDKINGSKGFTDTLRATCGVLEDPLDPTIKHVLSITNNLLPPNLPPLEYKIAGDPELNDSHVIYKQPLPEIGSTSMDQLEAAVLAQLIDAARPLSSQELATYMRLSHAIVKQLLTKAERDGRIEQIRSRWQVKALPAPTPEETTYA